MEKKDLIKISDYLWEIPKRGEMRVPARIYISEKMLDEVFDQDLSQQKGASYLVGDSSALFHQDPRYAATHHPQPQKTYPYAMLSLHCHFAFK